MKTRAQYIYMGKGKKLLGLVEEGLLKPDQLMSFHPSQKLMGNLGRGQGSAQTVTNKGKFKLCDMAVMGRSEFLIPPPPAASGPLAATRQSDPSQAHLQK